MISVIQWFLKQCRILNIMYKDQSLMMCILKDTNTCGVVKFKATRIFTATENGYVANLEVINHPRRSVTKILSTLNFKTYEYF